jgi:MoaA/NifB/PqqE/SkfB family radical SAM enzyme
MKLTGLHLLLTYECNFECDHCFVWSGPKQHGTMTLDRVERVLDQAAALGGLEWIYFEGGEPFLYYGVLLAGVRRAAERGFRVGIVSNAYWATAMKDALEWLRPMARLVQRLQISSDLYHGREPLRPEAKTAAAAADELGIPTGIISVAQPERADAPSAVGQLPESESAVMYRGRAAERLAPDAPKHPWAGFTACPYENLRDPGRVHVDPLGHVHICQGISLGNLFETPLAELCASYDPDAHPITGPLLAGGPAELARREKLVPADGYADACHLCDAARRELRDRYPDILAPDQVYGK